MSGPSSHSDDRPEEGAPAAIRDFERPARGGFVYRRADRSKRNTPWLRGMRRARRWLLFPVVRYLGATLFRAYSWTWRPRIGGAHPDNASVLGGGPIGCFWHGRALAVLGTLGRTTPADVLVSHSGDGQLVMQLLRGLGLGVVEGSRSRGGARAAREMLASLRAGRLVAITPDGPRGPIHTITQGVAFLSRETAHPVVPIGLAVDRGWYANSWDHFVLPRPFARVACWVGPLIQVPADADEDQLRAHTLEIREAMLEAERRAAQELGVEVDW